MVRRLSVLLTHSANPYTQRLKQEVEVEAAEHGFVVDTQCADDRFLQVKQLYSVIHCEPRYRPKAMLVDAAFGGLGRVAAAALSRGIDWVSLHQSGGDLDALRRQFPERTVGLIGPDYAQIGRQQGRLARRWAPGGHILYVQGSVQSPSACAQLAGFSEVIDPGREIIGLIDGNWTMDDSAAAVERWLNVMNASVKRLDLVVAQNDAMAAGAMLALRSAARRHGRQDLETVRLIGSDGVPDAGAKLVDEGHLCATVTLRGVGTHAVRLIGQRADGRMTPDQVVVRTYKYPSVPGTDAPVSDLQMLEEAVSA